MRRILPAQMLVARVVGWWASRFGRCPQIHRKRYAVVCIDKRWPWRLNQNQQRKITMDKVATNKPTNQCKTVRAMGWQNERMAIIQSPKVNYKGKNYGRIYNWAIENYHRKRGRLLCARKEVKRNETAHRVLAEERHTAKVAIKSQSFFQSSIE